jgi:hypothetical protein
MWSDYEFDQWCKDQTKLFKKHGLNSSTAGITRLLYSKIIIPNGINMDSLIKGELKLKKVIKKDLY